MKLLPALSLILMLISASPLLAAIPLNEPEILTGLLQEAEQKNPALLAAREKIAIAVERPAQVSALPDPQLSVGFLNYPVDELRSDVTPMTGNDFKLAQKFPFPGKLASKREIARQQQIWAEAKYADLLLQVRQQVRDSWFRLGFQRQAVALTRHHLNIMDDISRLAETRYKVGKGLQQQVLAAQVERSRLFDTLLKYQKDAEISQARINSLVGRPTDQSLGDIPQPVEIPYNPTLASLQQQARKNRPMFKGFDALIGQFEQKQKLAQLDYRPDFNLWAGYRFRDDDLPDGGTDFVSTGFSINLPFPVAKRRAAVQEADAGQRMAHQQRNDFARQVDFELHRALTELQQARKLIELYGTGIIPQAEQAYKSTLTAYQVDKVDFLVLHDSLMTLYRYRVDYARNRAAAQRSIARLKATAGLDEINPNSPTQPEKDAPHA